MVLLVGGLVGDIEARRIGYGIADLEAVEHVIEGIAWPAEEVRHLEVPIGIGTQERSDGGVRGALQADGARGRLGEEELRVDPCIVGALHAPQLDGAARARDQLRQDRRIDGRPARLKQDARQVGAEPVEEVAERARLVVEEGRKDPKAVYGLATDGFGKLVEEARIEVMADPGQTGRGTEHPR